MFKPFRLAVTAAGLPGWPAADNLGVMTGLPETMPTSWRDRLTDEVMLDRQAVRHLPRYWQAESKGGMVVSAHYHATRAGVAVLEDGGNAVDAAVATAFALAVTESAGSGLGGMAMMVVHHAASGRTVVFPGACRAPRRATPEAVQSSPRYYGYRAVAVPTFVAVMNSALETYGTQPVPALLADATELAESGYTVTALQSRLIGNYDKAIRKCSAAAIFLDADGEALAPGTRLLQPALGRTLRRLSTAGLTDFYQGRIASQIASDMRAHDGFVDLDDLADVTRIQPVKPLAGDYRGDALCVAGPPAGGRTLLLMLNLYRELASHRVHPDSPEGVCLVAEIIRRARIIRRTHRLESGSDPTYETEDFARAEAEAIRRRLGDCGETSHICVLDRSGNGVSLTQSLERSFGAKVMTPELGFLYNGYMKAFKIRAKRHPHYLRPGAVARSNAAPALVVRDGTAQLAIGSTGSERMLSGIFEVLLRLGHVRPFHAVHAPRYHATPEGEIWLEATRVPEEVLHRLRSLGFKLKEWTPYAFQAGGLQLALREGPNFVGVTEPRRDGAAAGPASAE